MSGADQAHGRWLAAMPAVFVLIWSTGFIVARYGMPHAPPLSFLCVRYALSVLCFGAWVAVAGVPLPRSRAQWGHLAVTGVLMHAGYLGGVWAAVKAGMGSGLSSLIVGLQPVLTAAWMSWHGSRVSRWQWLGLLLGFGGLVLVVSAKMGQGGEASWQALSLAVMALFSITIGTLYQKRHVTPCDVRSASAVQLGAALLVSLPLAWLEPEAIAWTPELIGAVAWSVLALSLGASSLLYLLIQRGAATSVTSLLYLVPPCTAALAWSLFGEPITGLTLAGTALTAVGVSLVVRAPRRA
ncbi:MAG: DMT family transporter [Curvibacter lanceolatus]|uniref:DMT family transporter n=1 Tax=Curvibacter lanceolatus TaxID=86182 RepID=UPI002356EA8D|nr:DMT family transporter [Curvibacter lanceolatus]MBV5290738.1 DMT family transporter [Curvibacter lanceolatus]